MHLPLTSALSNLNYYNFTTYYVFLCTKVYWTSQISHFPVVVFVSICFLFYSVFALRQNQNTHLLSEFHGPHFKVGILNKYSILLYISSLDVKTNLFVRVWPHHSDCHAPSPTNLKQVCFNLLNIGNAVRLYPNWSEKSCLHTGWHSSGSSTESDRQGLVFV